MLISDLDATIELVPTKPLWHTRRRRVGASTASVQTAMYAGALVLSSMRRRRLCVQIDYATITIVGEVLVGTEHQMTSSMSDSMEDPLGLSLFRD